MALSDYDVLTYGYGAGLAAIKLKHFSATDAPTFAPRISSSQTETDLDGTLHYTFPVDHGFNHKYDEDNKNYRVFGNYNTVDGNLYPNLPFSSISTGSTYTGLTYNWSAKTSTHKASYLAYRENATNKIYQIDTAGTLTALSPPAAVSAASLAITGITPHKTYLYFGFNNATLSANAYRYNIPAGTWQDITGAIYKFASLRNRLYGVQISGEVWSVTNEEAAGAATYTSITKAGPWNAAWDQVLEVCTFNGAIWITKQSGLYRFDGVDAIRIFDHRLDYMTEHQGALYFLHAGWLTRFNGSLYEKIKYFGSAEPIQDLQSHSGNLYILTAPNVTDFKFGGHSGTDGTIDNRIFEFDGVNFRVIYEADETTSLKLLSSVGDRLLMPTAPNGSFAASIKQLNFADRYKAKSSAAPDPYIITADFDGSLPNIIKLLRSVEVDVANADSSSSISITYERFINGTWSSVSGTLAIASLNAKRNIVRLPDDFEPNIFERLRLKVELNAAVASSISLTSFTIHYTLHPTRKKDFTLTIPIFNDDEPTESLTSPLGMEHESYTVTHANAKNYYFEELFAPDNGHFYLTSPDYSVLHAAELASDTAMIVKGAFGHSTTTRQQLALIVDPDDISTYEVISYSVSSMIGHNTTSLSFVTRGLANTVALDWDAGSYIYPLYEIGNSRVLTDIIDLSPTSAIVTSNGSKQVQRELTVKLTEV